MAQSVLSAAVAAPAMARRDRRRTLQAQARPARTGKGTAARAPRAGAPAWPTPLFLLPCCWRQRCRSLSPPPGWSSEQRCVRCHCRRSVHSCRCSLSGRQAHSHSTGAGFVLGERACSASGLGWAPDELAACAQTEHGQKHAPPPLPLSFGAAQPYCLASWPLFMTLHLYPARCFLLCEAVLSGRCSGPTAHFFSTFKHAAG